MDKSERLEFAKSVIDNPGDYKVCVVCRALVDKNEAVCPDCAAYRFDESVHSVQMQAEQFALKDPETLGHSEALV